MEPGSGAMNSIKTQYPAESARLVLISVNPTAGARSGGERVGQLCQLLEERGFTTEAITDLAELQEKVRVSLDDGHLRVVVAAGGDGTVGCVLNETPLGTPLTVLPLGTENLFSKYLGIKRQAASVADVVTAGATVRLDAGRANDRLFLLMFSCGFDAEVVRRLEDSRAGHIRHLSYARPILQSVLGYDYPEVRIEWPDELELPGLSPPLLARWTFVVNLPRYAFGLTTAPQASGTDGLFDICTFRHGSLLHGLRYLAAVVLRRQSSLPDCTTLQLPRLRLESDRPVPYQIDGDVGGELPVDVEIVPGGLTVMVPESWIEAQHDDTATGPG